MTGPAEFQVLTEMIDGTVVRVRVIGELDLATTSQVEAALGRQHQAGHDVLLDLSGLEFIDSSGMRVVVEALQDAKANGWNLGIDARLSQPVKRAFEISGLLPSLPIVE